MLSICLCHRMDKAVALIIYCFFKFDGLCVYVCIQYLGAVSALIFGLSQSFRDCTLC